jgi:hypothetical protein
MCFTVSIKEQQGNADAFSQKSIHGFVFKMNDLSFLECAVPTMKRKSLD